MVQIASENTLWQEQCEMNVEWSENVSLVAFDSMGQVVNPGDTIIDFRGDHAIFVTATREAGSQSGRVVVRWKALHGVKNQPGSCYYDDGRVTQYEYYDKVFDLTVKEIDD